MSVYCGKCDARDECGANPWAFAECQDNAVTMRIDEPERSTAMEAKIEVSMDNAAFADDRTAELARILRELAAKIEKRGVGWDYATIMDVNGNQCGVFWIEED